MPDQSNWPLIARTLARLARPEDKGLGDTLHRHAARFGGDEFKALFKRLMGRDCGCMDRQAKLNARYPYR